MSASIPSSGVNLVNLGNLLAPASGVTHAAIFLVTVANSTAQINMVQLQSSIGWPFQPQAMSVDNIAGADPIVIGEVVTGWRETVPAGVKRTFQFASPTNAQFTFECAGAQTFQVMLFDFPMFPDNNTGGNSTQNVQIVDQPVQVTEQLPTLVYTAGDTTAVTVGGTAVNAFNAASITTGGVIYNPLSNAAPIYVNPVAAAGTAEGGTTFALQPGQRFNVGKASGAISVNSAAPQTFVAYRY